MHKQGGPGRCCSSLFTFLDSLSSPSPGPSCWFQDQATLHVPVDKFPGDTGLKHECLKGLVNAQEWDPGVSPGDLYDKVRLGKCVQDTELKQPTFIPMLEL